MSITYVNIYKSGEMKTSTPYHTKEEAILCVESIAKEFNGATLCFMLKICGKSSAQITMRNFILPLGWQLSIFAKRFCLHNRILLRLRKR